MASADQSGWPSGAGDADLALAFARCFRGRDGEWVLAYLKAMTLDRALGPNVADATLRHLEGQRQLVAYMLNMVERGRGTRPTASSIRPSHDDSDETGETHD
jgi:hypothetical protein